MFGNSYGEFVVSGFFEEEELMCILRVSCLGCSSNEI